MKLDITPTEAFSFASVTTTDSDIVKVIISVDTHSTNTLRTQAIQRLYAGSLLAGAGSYSREEFLDAVNLLGASIEVDVTDARVSFILRSTTAQFAKLWRLFETLLQEPTFAKGELTRVKSTTLNQLHQAKEDSKGIAQDELRNLFYASADRKYTHSIDKYMNEVPQVTTAQLKTFHQVVLAGAWFCSAAGDQPVVEQLQRKLKKIKTQVTQPESVHQPKPAKPTLHLEQIASRQNIDLSIGVPLPITRAHPDFIPLVFAVAVLGKWGGFAGRLMSTVREKEGLTYGIYSQLEGFAADEQGYFRIMTFFAPDKAVQGLTSTFRELQKLYATGVTSAEVTAFKRIINTQQALVNDSLSRVLADLHGYHSEGFTIDEMNAHKAALKTVTRQEVNAAIKTYLEPKQMSVSAAGPIQSVKPALKQWMS